MNTIALVLAVLASVAAQQASADLVGQMELKHNVEGFPLLGHLKIYDDRATGGELRAEVNISDSPLKPGTYYGYVHARADFTNGCNSTGNFVEYRKSSGYYFLKPADIIISHDGLDKTVNVHSQITLAPGESNSVMDEAIVFHDRSVRYLLKEGLEYVFPGLHHTSVFCGRLSKVEESK